MNAAPQFNVFTSSTTKTFINMVGYSVHIELVQQYTQNLIPYLYFDAP